MSSSASASPWETINPSNSLCVEYGPLNLTLLNKDRTIHLRRGFNSVIQVMDSMITKEKEYLMFLAKRATVPPRCFFTAPHKREVEADLAQITRLKQRMTTCRDKLLVLGDDAVLPQDTQVVEVYLPQTEPVLDASELGMALYGVA